MTNFLDKLAMKVSVWGEGRVIWFKCTNGLITAIGGSFFGEIVVESQWLQRRKELINEPRDIDAPEWAKWKAQDFDGEWFWYGGKPKDMTTRWGFGDGGIVDIGSKGKIPAGHDWRKTLKEVKRKTKVEAEEVTDPIESEVIRTIAMMRIENNRRVSYELRIHLKKLLEMQRNEMLAVGMRAEDEGKAIARAVGRLLEDRKIRSGYQGLGSAVEGMLKNKDKANDGGNGELRNPYVITVGGNIYIKDVLIGESIKSAQLTSNQTSRAQEKEDPIKGIALRFKGEPLPPFPAALKHGAVKKSEDLKIDDVVAVPLLGGIVTGRVTETQEDGFVAVHVDADMSLATKNWYFLERPL